MKKLLIIFLVAVGFVADAQNYQTVGTRYRWPGGAFTRNLSVPIDTFSIPVAERDLPHIAIKEDSLYLWSIAQQQWYKNSIGGTGSGGTYSNGWGLALGAGVFRVDTSAGNVATQFFVNNAFYTKTQINSFFGGTSPISGYNKTQWDLAHSWGNHAGLYPTISRFMDSVNDLRTAIESGIPSGDMTKAVYDPGNNGIVDSATGAQKLGGQLPAYYQQALSGTGLVKSVSGTISYISDFSNDWNTAYTDRLKWDGGATGLNAATGRTSLGFTTWSGNLITTANPSAVRYIRINADNTISLRTAAEHLADIGGISSYTETDPDFDANGVKLTGNQTIGDDKTFTNAIKSNHSVQVYDGADLLAIVGPSSVGSFNYGSLQLRNKENAFSSTLLTNILTGAHVHKLPDSTGTLPIAIYANGTRYNANSKGTIDLGTISGGGGITLPQLTDSIGQFYKSIYGLPDSTGFVLVRYDGTEDTVSMLGAGGSSDLSDYYTITQVDSAIAANLGSGVTTMAAVGTTANANGASISGNTLTLQPANGTHPGVLTATTQNIAGAKTFLGPAFLGSGVRFNVAEPALGGYTITGDDFYVRLADGLVANSTITLPSLNAGRTLVIINTNSTGFAYSFNTAVKDAAGTNVTAITNQTVYTLVATSTNWQIVSKYQ